MVYQSGFVVCVLVNGKVANELNGKCELNEGDEYTVRLRNKTDRRAACELFIDGEVQGNYVVNAKYFVDIERSVGKNAAFKFTHIDSSESIDQGKNSLTIDSGKIKAIFRFEKIEYHYIQKTYVYQPPVYPYVAPWNSPHQWATTICKGGSNVSQTFNTSQNVTRGLSCNAAITNTGAELPRKDVGVTVEGKETSQSFYTVSFPLEYSIAAVIEIKLKLKQPESENVLSKGKNIYCSQCGVARESARAKFCVNCGHKLKT